MSHFGSTAPRRRFTTAHLLRIGGLAVVVIALSLGWWGYRRSIDFEGAVVEKDRRTRWSQVFRPTARQSVRYRHYLVLENEQGEQRRLRVRWQTYERAEIGDPAAKRSGQMWARLMTEEAIERREASREGMQMIWDAVTSGGEEAETP